MSEFRSYLDNRGSVLSHNQELAAYFALPYIPEPSKHPTFQNLFMVRGGGRMVEFIGQEYNTVELLLRKRGSFQWSSCSLSLSQV